MNLILAQFFSISFLQKFYGTRITVFRTLVFAKLQLVHVLNQEKIPFLIAGNTNVSSEQLLPVSRCWLRILLKPPQETLKDS